MLKNILILLLALTTTPQALSEGVANNFKVVHVRADASGKGYIKFDKILQNTPPSCVSSVQDKKLAFDTTTAGGKSILSLALAAQATGTDIYAKGNGKCDIYGTVESWSWGYLIK